MTAISNKWPLEPWLLLLLLFKIDTLAAHAADSKDTPALFL